MSREDSAIFVTDAGATQVLKLQNVDERLKIDFWVGGDREAIDGSIDSGLRGYRREHELAWDYNTEASEIQDLINSIIADVEAGKNWFYFGFDEDRARRVVLDEDNKDRIQYKAVIESQDLGFITDSVTEQRDYEFIQ